MLKQQNKRTKILRVRMSRDPRKDAFEKVAKGKVIATRIRKISIIQTRVIRTRHF
jgi:hypothetical protein